MRHVPALIAALLLLAGTLTGTDDDFPFGPFRMFATTDRLDAPVADTRVEAVDTAGRPVIVTERNTGIRRAEIEGQLDRLRTDPALLAVVAHAYARHNPQQPPLGRIDVIIRWHELRDGRPTGGYHDETLVSWAAP